MARWFSLVAIAGLIACSGTLAHEAGAPPSTAGTEGGPGAHGDLPARELPQGQASAAQCPEGWQAEVRRCGVELQESDDPRWKPGVHIDSEVVRRTCTIEHVVDALRCAGNLRVSWSSFDESDLRSLAQIREQVEWLWLESPSNSLTRLEGLSVFAEVRDLRIDKFPAALLVPVGALASMSKLERISSTAELDDFDALGRIPSLVVLELKHTSTASLQALARLTRLKVLGLSAPRVGDVSPLAGLPNLQSVTISDSLVEDPSALASTKVTLLELRGSRVSRAELIAPITSIQLLDISQSRIADIAPLLALPKLDVLRLDGCPIEDFSPLAHMPNLGALSLNQTRFSDAKLLQGLTRLTGLQLRGTRVRDLRPLTELLECEIVDVRDTQVTTIAPLFKLPQLETLGFSGTRIPEWERQRAAYLYDQFD